MDRFRDKLFALLAALLAGCGAEQPMTPVAPPVKERHAAAKANSPEEQNAVRKEISAAQQAGNAATGKYRRGMEFLRSVQARRGETPAP